jgi:hypothetical protein
MAIGVGFTGAPRGAARAFLALLAVEAVYRVAVRSHVRRAIGMTLHDEPVPVRPVQRGSVAAAAKPS